MVGWSFLQRNMDVVVEGAWIRVFLEGAVSLGLTDPWSWGGMLTSSWGCVPSRSLSGSLCSPQARGSCCRGKWNLLKVICNLRFFAFPMLKACAI